MYSALSNQTFVWRFTVLGVDKLIAVPDISRDHIERDAVYFAIHMDLALHSDLPVYPTSVLDTLGALVDVLVLLLGVAL